jgi:septum formation protein
VIQHEELVLASRSPARAALLRAAGIRFRARASRVDEGAVKEAARQEGGSAEDVALALAALKAGRVRAPAETMVVGADQMLVCGDRWFDKPEDMIDARRHLLALRGRTHELVTAVVCLRGTTVLWRHVARPALTMRAFGDAFLDAYLAAEGERLLGSVGAYRLEAGGVHLFERIEGEQAAILGLPMLPLLAFLRESGVLGG